MKKLTNRELNILLVLVQEQIIREYKLKENIVYTCELRSLSTNLVLLWG